MMFTVDRDSPPSPERTFGVMTFSGSTLVLQSLERPWIPDPDGGIGGHPMTSCVAEGLYDLKLHDSTAHPKTWALVNPALGVWHLPQDIPAGTINGRSLVLVHNANLVIQLKGCIAVGLARSQLNGEPDVASSVTAMTRLREAVPWIEGHTLLIRSGA